MNKNAKAWVTTLRSGRYRQGRNVLHQGKKYCCLGVACDLAIKAGVKIAVFTGGGVNRDITTYDGVADTLPKSVQNWLGLRTDVGEFRPPKNFTVENNAFGGVCNTLTALNDSAQLSFKKIADIIESQPKGLFKTRKRRKK
jgi:hypothetical protein